MKKEKKELFLLYIAATNKRIHRIAKSHGATFNFPMRAWELEIEPSKFPKSLESHLLYPPSLLRQTE